ncbi:flagellar hook-basal body complex protein FliE [Actinotalea sp. M2MS4P-6]|uniref:flagellar hook-basal body complex protein FliE n=1 Tax=Actinotalea sp. M2MS4P-6 TaxID=2983762 RepID=UPI0021E50139|nr:flagellar hook-basal body complex protein FliE [Actinotalea sp. M2MS4P-6]MCV2392791.1 flagellar hook-basal body complex protein FliE [Actinotalea sp. M2MS4P-6]
MSIQAIGALGASTGVQSLSALTGSSATTGTSSTTGAGSSSGVFGTTLAGQIDQVQALQSNADALAVQAVTGDLNDIHDYTIAASEASVAMELTAALRNKAVEAFTEIMRMQA